MSALVTMSQYDRDHPGVYARAYARMPLIPRMSRGGCEADGAGITMHAPMARLMHLDHHVICATLLRMHRYPRDDVLCFYCVKSAVLLALQGINQFILT